MTRFPRPPCYAITGHHRSGTSMVASMLQSSGLDIGGRLLGANDSNRFGHFEDMDFYEFHLEVLKAQGFHHTGAVVQPSVPVPEPYRERAAALVAHRNSGNRPWGWKEPRTTLFLDFWTELIPQLRCVLLFRPPWEVLDSLFRRGDVEYLNNPAQAARVWVNYGRAILDFQSRQPDRCIIVESLAAGREPVRLTAALAEKFGHYFNPPAPLYDEQAYVRDDASRRRALLVRSFPEAIELYEQLRARADVVIAADAEPPARDDSAGAWAFQDWVDCRAAQRQHKLCVAELLRSRDEATRLAEELRQAQEAAKQCVDELHVARSASNATEDEVLQARQAVATANAAFQEARQAAERAQADCRLVRAERDDALSRADREGADARTAETAARRFAEETAAARGDLAQIRAELEQLRAAFDGVCAEFHTLVAKQHRIEADLARHTNDARAARDHINWMETSKFWKARRYALLLKRIRFWATQTG